mmetsp:Transcript_9352/g.26930  ORF Transcript_9352/g.26930 Transcript_9352/m.26930 type:complete len:102 (+) Transcript_9352:1289-1594(+)
MPPLGAFQSRRSKQPRRTVAEQATGRRRCVRCDRQRPCEQRIAEDAGSFLAAMLVQTAEMHLRLGGGRLCLRVGAVGGLLAPPARGRVVSTCAAAVALLKS